MVYKLCLINVFFSTVMQQIFIFFGTEEACVQDPHCMTFPWDVGDPDFNSLDLEEKYRHTKSHQRLILYSSPVVFQTGPVIDE